MATLQPQRWPTLTLHILQTHNKSGIQLSMRVSQELINRKKSFTFGNVARYDEVAFDAQFENVVPM